MATKDEIKQAIEQRLAAIDEQLAALDDLVAEREELRRALAELSGAGTARGVRQIGHHGGVRRRRGANREAVLQYLGAEGQSTAATIAEATDINRSVIYNLLARMADKGDVARLERDGETVYTVPGG